MFFTKKTGPWQSTDGTFSLPDGSDDGSMLYMVQAVKIPDELVKVNEDETFYRVFERLREEKNLKSSQCYGGKDGIMSKQTFSNITRQGSNPTKKSVIQLALYMELNIEETERLLKAAGYAFREADEDLILSYCISHRIYDTEVISKTLEERGCDTGWFDCKTYRTKNDGGDIE